MAQFATDFLFQQRAKQRLAILQFRNQVMAEREAQTRREWEEMTQRVLAQYNGHAADE